MTQRTKIDRPVSEMTMEEISGKLRDLTKRKIKLIQWLKTHIKSEGTRKRLMENAAYMFVNEQYELQIEIKYRQLAKLRQFQISLRSGYQRFLIEQKLELEEFHLAVAKMKNQRAQLAVDTKRLLAPPDANTDKLKAILEEERIELVKQQLSEKRRKHRMETLTADAAERVRLRAEYKKAVQAEFDNPEDVEEAMDYYDRMVFEKLESGEESE